MYINLTTSNGTGYVKSINNGGVVLTSVKKEAKRYNTEKNLDEAIEAINNILYLMGVMLIALDVEDSKNGYFTDSMKNMIKIMEPIIARTGIKFSAWIKQRIGNGKYPAEMISRYKKNGDMELILQYIDNAGYITLNVNSNMLKSNFHYDILRNPDHIEQLISNIQHIARI